MGTREAVPFMAGPGGAVVRELPPFAEEEFDAVCRSICRRIKEGSIPPDDAYWWTRVLFADAVFVTVYASGLGRTM